ncbi:MAG: PD-(D/E)XK nuclease family protein [Puia sp.]|nr:PD-(D/E)XK nuclease family protein [Puia sp.]
MERKIPWDNTARNTLSECNRKYYFSQLIASKSRTKQLPRKVHELKKMQNISMWQGSVVDRFMETEIIPRISEKKPMDFTALAEQAVELAKKQFEYSRLAIYTDPVDGKLETAPEFCILDIHELGKPFEEREVVEAYDNIRAAILGLPEIRMPDGQTLLGFLQQCNRLTPNVYTWMVEIERAVVKPQIDLLALHDWKPVIIDWKLSRSHTANYARQLTICGIVVYLKRLATPDKKPYRHEDIRLFEVNLFKGVVKSHPFTAERANEMIDEIHLTSEDIALLLGENEEPDIRDFEGTDNDGSCKICNFRSICAFLYLNDVYDEKAFTEFVQANQFA